MIHAAQSFPFPLMYHFMGNNVDQFFHVGPVAVDTDTLDIVFTVPMTSAGAPAFSPHVRVIIDDQSGTGQAATKHSSIDAVIDLDHHLVAGTNWGSVSQTISLFDQAAELLSLHDVPNE